MPTLFKVQKALPGIAKFLGIESQGILAMEASNVIQPVIEMDDYLGPNPFVQLEDPAVPLNGTIELEVPANRFWRLKWASLTVDTPAGVYTNGIVNVVPAESGLSFQISPTFSSYYASAAATFLGNYQFGNSEASGFGFNVQGVNARPGDKIQAQLVNGTGLGNSRVRLFLQYQELEL